MIIFAIAAIWILCMSIASYASKSLDHKHLRKKILYRLAHSQREYDGGHLLEFTYGSKWFLEKLMKDLISRGFVVCYPSESDPFWRDTYKITDDGRKYLETL